MLEHLCEKVPEEADVGRQVGGRQASEGYLLLEANRYYMLLEIMIEKRGN